MPERITVRLDDAVYGRLIETLAHWAAAGESRVHEADESTISEKVSR